MTTPAKKEFYRSPLRSEEKVRALDAESLFPSKGVESLPIQPLLYTESLAADLDEEGRRLFLEVQELLKKYAGVVFTGPPGTSKSWYAAQIAAEIVEGNRERVRFIQFHASYQYEDFIEGYVPKKDGSGFALVDKHLLDMCDVARRYEGQMCLIVIDELSRSDPGRVFGEALTYIEPTKRNQPFHLASGRTASIPPNLYFIATMNPQDRGVDEVDAALERRFAKIAMNPDSGLLDVLLTQNGMDADLRGRVIRFFRFLLGNSNERCRVGHAYFRAMVTEDDLRSLWEHQLRFFMERAFPMKGDALRAVEAEWKKTFPATTTGAAGVEGSTAIETDEGTAPA